MGIFDPLENFSLIEEPKDQVSFSDQNLSVVCCRRCRCNRRCRCGMGLLATCYVTLKESKQYIRGF